MKDYITIIGGGLAGCEAAYQIAKRGIKVKLYEMKPVKFTEAHSNKNLVFFSITLPDIIAHSPYQQQTFIF